MPDAAELAQAHWNETPLFLTEEERYSTYPWLYEVAEFGKHRGEKVLEVGCGTGSDLLQFAKHGALAECRPFQFLSRWFGWFLVVKGQKT